MDAKKTINKFIKPNIVLPIILLIPPLTPFGLILLLCATLPISKTAKKNLAALEANGELEKAAQEMTSPDAKHLIKNRAILTEHYIFCKNTGIVLPYDKIKWIYKHRFTRSFLFIPIQVTDSLYLATQDMKPRAVASMGKDKKEQIKAAMVEIYTHNNSCMIGYSKENITAFKAMRK